MWYLLAGVIVYLSLTDRLRQYLALTAPPSSRQPKGERGVVVPIR